MERRALGSCACAYRARIFGMEHASTFALVFVTLFLLCRAELSGSWYSANVINDGDFSSRPVSESFSSETPPFSSTHPIVVLPPSSTLAPPISTSPPPASVTYSTGITPEEFISTYSTTPSQSSYVPSLPTTQQTIDPNGFPESKPQFDIRQPFPFLFPQQDKQQPPNYFVVYQAPQSQQSLPPSPPPEQSTPQSTWSTSQSTWSTPQSTWSTLQQDLSSPLTFSTQAPEVSTPQTTFSTFQPEISTTSPMISSSQATLMSFRPSSDSTFPSNLPSSPVTNAPSSRSTTTRTVRTTQPCVNGTQGILQKFPTLRIRMVAPSGSITNININPTTTTKAPRTRRSTTTRKPTTTRTRKVRNNRNTYNKCVDACEGGGRRPICASPLAQIPVDPGTLKGFPSVCHMACHNSFKKDQYEMVVEGRCGRLRTRIRTVDSDSKLKRTELNKAQYTLVSDNQQTLVEVSALSRKSSKE